VKLIFDVPAYRARASPPRTPQNNAVAISIVRLPHHPTTSAVTYCFANTGGIERARRAKIAARSGDECVAARGTIPRRASDPAVSAKGTSKEQGR
jgi:hypothetical protein